VEVSIAREASCYEAGYSTHRASQKARLCGQQRQAALVLGEFGSGDSLIPAISAQLQQAFSAAGGYALLGAASSLLCVALGSFYLLFGEK